MVVFLHTTFLPDNFLLYMYIHIYIYICVYKCPGTCKGCISCNVRLRSLHGHAGTISTSRFPAQEWAALILEQVGIGKHQEFGLVNGKEIYIYIHIYSTYKYIYQRLLYTMYRLRTNTYIYNIYEVYNVHVRVYTYMFGVMLVWFIM